MQQRKIYLWLFITPLFVPLSLLSVKAWRIYIQRDFYLGSAANGVEAIQLLASAIEKHPNAQKLSVSWSDYNHNYGVYERKKHSLLIYAAHDNDLERGVTCFHRVTDKKLCTLAQYSLSIADLSKMECPAAAWSE